MSTPIENPSVRKVANPDLEISVGDVFYVPQDQNNITYVVMDDTPLDGRFSVRIMRGDTPEAYGSSDVTDGRMFARKVDRPKVPVIQEATFVYLHEDGSISLHAGGFGDDNSPVVAKHNLVEGTWRYTDGEIIRGFGW